VLQKLPIELLNALETVQGFDRAAFEEVHASGKQVTSVRINPLKWSDELSPNWSGNLQQIPWTDYGYYLDQRPSFTFDPLFHAGCYYVQEASSMFLEQAFKQLIDLSKPLKVLDISAAPGGKSTHIQSLISKESLLVSNEVIRNRCHILTDNIVKWGTENVVVTNNDPSHFKKLLGFFDVLVVDAPCSGSGLFRKDPGAIDEWSINNVTLCSQRQQRILAAILPALKEGGYLIYSTCSYSVEEDEAIADWLMQEMGMESESISVDAASGIVVAKSENCNAEGYRFYPHRLKGEGFFISVFRKKEEHQELKMKPVIWERAAEKDRVIINKWLDKDVEIIKDQDVFYAIPPHLSNDIALLQFLLNVQYKGVRLGQIMKDKLVPDHALALSQIIGLNVPSFELNFDQAIKYLQRQNIDTVPKQLGWQVITYQNQRLGWVNALSNRINNYYPKESRILKQHNDNSFEK
jgi:16S rRNA C967 or C1407 C5-methylase (RsmB/RsmF family)/NOL1/NOP2/fmu family ribosome biogenesis protein